MSEGEKSKSNVGKYIGCGCATVAVLGLLGITGCLFLITSAFKSAQPYKDSIAAVEQSA